MSSRHICLLAGYRGVVVVVSRVGGDSFPVLTLAKLHADSVAYYESTVDSRAGIEGYYSEDGRQPARAWIAGATDSAVVVMETDLGVSACSMVDGKDVRRWFNEAVAPSGSKLAPRVKSNSVLGFDMTFCAPKSASMLWGLTDDPGVRDAVNEAHEKAVAQALRYLETHASYTRIATPGNNNEKIIEKMLGLSGVRYEHRTSRSGDPHMHSHVLLNNKQLCADGKFRSLDGVSLYHETRAAGMLYQAQLRAELSTSLGGAMG